MPRLEREGVFKASVATWALSENERTGTLQFALSVNVAFVKTPEDWQDCSAESLEFTGWLYLSKRDGTLNESSIRSLKEALGWNGDIATLQEEDWSGRLVQITTGWEDHQGKRRLKLKFLNAQDYEGGGLTPPTPEAVKALSAKWGAKFRALGGQPAPADPAQTVMSAKNKAWSAVLALYGGETASATPAWHNLLKKVFPDKPAAQFTAADWAEVERRKGEALPI